MTTRGRRRSGGPDTREAILASARELFAERGYDRTTMRAVAAAAGVDAALIHHYFGTKEGLLAESLVLPVDPAELFAGVDEDPARTGEELVRRALAVWEREDVRERLVALLRSGLSNEQAAAQVRDLFGRTVIRALGRTAAPDDAELRATLVGTQIGGLFLGRYVLRVPGVGDAAPDQLVAAVGPVIQHYLYGPLAGAAVAGRRRGASQ